MQEKEAQMIKEQQEQLAQQGRQQSRQVQGSNAAPKAVPPSARPPAANASKATPKELQQAEASFEVNLLGPAYRTVCHPVRSSMTEKCDCIMWSSPARCCSLQILE